MGMYLCASCYVATGAMSARLMTCVSACEVCGELRGDWSRKFTDFTWELDRAVGDPRRLPVAEQIARLRARIGEIAAHAATIDPED